jgi:hypothetical protein
MTAEAVDTARVPRQGTFDAIDFAVEQLGIESFADLDMGRTYGEHAFYAIDKPTVREGVLADARPTRARDQLLTAIERAAERPGMRVVDGDALDLATINEIGQVDAILMFNVLLHTVAPDWGRVLELYAPRTSCFVIANPQWQGNATVRLIDLGREQFLEAVPPSAAHRDLFDHLDEWDPAQNRAYRDLRSVWQWGITDADLVAKLDELDFGLAYERSLGPFPGADAFENKAFVFSRSERPGADGASERELAELRARLTAMERERDELRARHDRIERTLADVLGSRSWRLTKPLRVLKRR